jgi:hypothetical protein
MHPPNRDFDFSALAESERNLIRESRVDGARARGRKEVVPEALHRNECYPPSAMQKAAGEILEVCCKSGYTTQD